MPGGRTLDATRSSRARFLPIGVLMLLALVLTLSTGPPDPDPLRPIHPPYAAGYLCARPGYHDGRCWAPTQPWFYLPQPILSRR